MMQTEQKLPWLHLPDAGHIHQVAWAWIAGFPIYFALFCWGVSILMRQPSERPTPDLFRRRVVMCLVDMLCLTLLVAYVCPEPRITWLMNIPAVGLIVFYRMHQAKKKQSELTK